MNTELGENIKFVDSSNTYSDIIKYRKLINNNIFKNYVKNYIDNNLNNKFNHEWTKHILYYNVKETAHIYFKKYFITIINLKEELDYENIIKNVFDKIFFIIKNKNIKLSINYIFDILNINYDDINKDKLNIFEDTEIEFSLLENDLYFFIKNNEYFKCKREEISININNNIILNKYQEIKTSKIKIAFINHDFIINNNKDYIYNFIKYFYQQGYWVDFIHCSKHCQIFSPKLDFIKQLLNYDIFIYQGSSFSILYETFTGENKDFDKEINENFNLFQNKMQIIVPDSYSFDIHHSILSLKNNIHKFIHIGRRKIDYIEKYLSSNWWTTISSNDRLLKIYNLFKNNLSYESNIFTIDSSNKNDSFLERENFFKINNLDPKKKLVTFFLEWPKVNPDEILSLPIDNLEKLIYSKKFQEHLLNLVKIFESKNLEVIFKIHPSTSIYIDNNNLYIIDAKYNSLNNNFKYNNYPIDVEISNKDEWGIKFLIEKFNFVDNSFQNEILKYTDYGVIFSPTSTAWYTYLNNFPLMIFDYKDNKKSWINTYFNLNEESKIKRNKIINELKKNNIPFDHNKIIDHFDTYYGKIIYIEDIINNTEDVVKEFLEYDHKGNYKYFKNHPLYGNTYYSNYKDWGDKIIDLIKSNNNLKDTSKKINFSLNKYFMKIYAKEYLKVTLENNILIQEIIKPSIVSSYGVTFYVSYYKNNCEVTLEFESKINDCNEEIYPRIYTGIKWITLDTKLCNEYAKYSIKELFNFKNKSDWRLSSTSRQVGHQIYFKNIQFS